jgi:RNA polymerase sigma-70 factor, ECF subfamily
VEIDDLLQSIFASFFRGIQRGYYDVPFGEELWKLLLVIALNKLRAQGNYHTAAKRDVRLSVGGIALEGLAIQNEAALNTLRLVIEEVMQHLPVSAREVVALRIEGREVADISTLTRRSRRTVERILQDFRRRLEEALQ